FVRPAAHPSGRLLLHCGAADWEATVWVNGKEVGSHRGGYDPFTLDITDALRPTDEQELVVAVWDPTDAGTPPPGKPVRQPRGGRVIDEVTSYFGMRSMALAKDAAGHTRLMLNGTPLFQYGLLDQGFWPDGLYAAPTDNALKSDIEATKKLGFNLARKHVKVE